MRIFFKKSTNMPYCRGNFYEWDSINKVAVCRNSKCPLAKNRERYAIIPKGHPSIVIESNTASGKAVVHLCAHCARVALKEMQEAMLKLEEDENKNGIRI